MSSLEQHFFDRGWVRFSYDPDVAEWVHAMHAVARDILADAQMQARWLRCGGTWFAGVNVLPNDARGAVPDAGVPPLAGGMVGFIRDVLGLEHFAWDRGQLSVCYPGYPQPWDGESDKAFRFRRDRDAAHLDGLLRHEPGRRRYLGEPHGFILGLPLDASDPQAAPLVVYEGSHKKMREVLQARLRDIAPENWAREDLTDCYVQARRSVFESCPRVAVLARPGEAYLVHRLAIHGVSPWLAPPGPPRQIVYFRPVPWPERHPDWWLERP